jgi:AraC-like DNA-binding protein
MQETLRGAVGGGLERSCDWIRPGAGAPGLERAEAFFSERAFDLHRHDTYAVGITCSGVQAFRYRGAQRIALPGQLHVLHPDELHDGGPATEEGFRYRIVYVEPDLIRRALDDAPLPFVEEPVQSVTSAVSEIVRLLVDIDEPISDLGGAEIAASVADALQALAGPAGPSEPIALRAVELVRDHLAAHANEQTPAAELERIAGLDRFAIARHFRRAFGTSPDRYRTMRRLDLARAAIARGVPLVRSAAEAGFSDQSHLTRQFKKAFGITPGTWAEAVAKGRSSS